MRLSKIFIEHFKGLDKMDVSPKGKDVTVRGKNGTGKTTVADAYAWCMTGKGFDGKTIDTQIKKRAEDGSTPNDGGVEHAVEVELEKDNGIHVILRREFKEKWEKHRGAADREFKGHTTTYTIDGVPLSKKEYDRKVSNLVNGDDTFQLLSCDQLVAQEVHVNNTRNLLALFRSKFDEFIAICLVDGLEFLETFVTSDNENVVFSFQNGGQFFVIL